MQPAVGCGVLAAAGIGNIDLHGTSLVNFPFGPGSPASAVWTWQVVSRVGQSEHPGAMASPRASENCRESLARRPESLFPPPRALGAALASFPIRGRSLPADPGRVFGLPCWEAHCPDARCFALFLSAPLCSFCILPRRGICRFDELWSGRKSCACRRMRLFVWLFGRHAG